MGSANVEQLITDHIDLWTSAIENKSSSGRGSSKKQSLYGIKKLRELILGLAVRGKLVPQDPNDEPASVLLERIAEERDRLVKEKKIKKPKKLPDLADVEKAFEIPDNWAWTCLNDLAEIGPRNDVDDDIDVSFVPMPMITTSYKGTHEQEVKVWKDIKKGYTHFADGDIAIAKITPCFENSKAAVFSGLVNGVGAGTTELHVARPFCEDLERLFILLYLKAPQFLAVGETKMTGSAGQKRVPKDFFSGNLIPLPPLEEQQRIVAKVDELMALCDQLEEQTENNLEAHQVLVEILLGTLTQSQNADELAENWERVAEHFDTLFTTEHSIDQLKQAILQLAVMGKLVPQDPSEEPASSLLEYAAVKKDQLIKDKKLRKSKALPGIPDDEKQHSIPSSWEWGYLTDIAAVGTGATPSRANPDYYEPAEVNWVTSGETSHDLITETGEKISSLAVEETNVSIYPPGALVMAMYGQGKTRGQISELAVPAGTNQACAAIQLFHTNSSHRGYIKLFFKKSYDDIRSSAAGAAQPNLNLGKVSSTIIPIPPLSEQVRIVSKVARLMNLCDQLNDKFLQVQKKQMNLADGILESTLS